VHDEARVALLRVPLEAGEDGQVELVIGLDDGVSEAHLDNTRHKGRREAGFEYVVAVLTETRHDGQDGNGSVPSS
jgi:hypothetical protein